MKKEINLTDYTNILYSATLHRNKPWLCERTLNGATEEYCQSKDTKRTQTKVKVKAFDPKHPWVLKMSGLFTRISEKHQACLMNELGCTSTGTGTLTDGVKLTWAIELAKIKDQIISMQEELTPELYGEIVSQSRAQLGKLASQVEWPALDEFRKSFNVVWEARQLSAQTNPLIDILRQTQQNLADDITAEYEELLTKEAKRFEEQIAAENESNSKKLFASWYLPLLSILFELLTRINKMSNSERTNLRESFFDKIRETAALFVAKNFTNDHDALFVGNNIKTMVASLTVNDLKLPATRNRLKKKVEGAIKDLLELTHQFNVNAEVADNLKSSAKKTGTMDEDLLIAMMKTFGKKKQTANDNSSTSIIEQAATIANESATSESGAQTMLSPTSIQSALICGSDPTEPQSAISGSTITSPFFEPEQYII